MESGILLTGLVLLALVAGPIIYMHYKRSRRQRFLENSLAQFAIANKLQISNYDLWNQQYAIGIDDSASYIVHLQISGKTVTDIKVPLSEKDMALVVKKEKGIALTIRNTVGVKATLEFYSGTELDTMEEETRLAEKWADIINKRN